MEGRSSQRKRGAAAPTEAPRPSGRFASDDREWLESDGLGGFASGTVCGIRTRRYHALLLAATRPPARRMALVNGLDAWIVTEHARMALTSQRYAPSVVHPDGAVRIESFETDPWPTWVYQLEDGARIQHELFAHRGLPLVALSWRILGRRRGHAALEVRPFLSGRDFHTLHHENPGFRSDAEVRGGLVTWHPYDGVPGIHALANARYDRAPVWYRAFRYTVETERGLDDTEDLASPGVFRWDLTDGEAALILAAGTPATDDLLDRAEPGPMLIRVRSAERRRRREPSRLYRSADTYLVARGKGKTLVAGYPWFGDWGRDTFVALSGLCLANGRLNEARDILHEWSGRVSDGMLPNRFSDEVDAPEYGSVDASLWYVIAVQDYLAARLSSGRPAPARERKQLQTAVERILEGYSGGTRFGIRMDVDGLLAAGVPGAALTWMDAWSGGWPVTPRIGKPVEVQALWLNALRIGATFSERWDEIFARGLASFRARFWDDARGALHDVVDADHEPGKTDSSFRPNQIFAVGGVPYPLLDGERAARMVAAVEEKLWTPSGLRTLAPDDPAYVGVYAGDPGTRDRAYHQGTVWPWLAGPFVEAWVRVRGGTVEAKEEARRRFLDPLLSCLDDAGLGHLSELADGDPPHRPRGCPFQAWSVAEALRLHLRVLADDGATPAEPATTHPVAAEKGAT